MLYNIIIESIEYCKLFTSKYIRYVFIMLIIICIICVIGLLCLLVVIIIFTYYVIKYLKINVVNDIYYSNHGYNKKSRDLLKKYGDYKIKNIYLIKNPISKMNELLLNLITFYGYNKKLNDLNMQLKEKYIPHHISVMIEIKNNKNTKWIWIEKTSYVNISEIIHFNKEKIIKKINIKNKDISLNDILQKTQNRIGNNKFFNWSIYQNNCSIFIQELLITLDLYNKDNMEFINQMKINNIMFNQLTLHTINIFCTINNIINHYFLY